MDIRFQCEKKFFQTTNPVHRHDAECISDCKEMEHFNGGNIIMNNRILKGIALILFGILLCTGSAEINSIILYRFSDFPFAFVGVIIGIEIGRAHV